MFWSPELKKERAAHKDDVERMLLMKNQCDSLHAEIKRLKAGDCLSDNRSEKGLGGSQELELTAEDKTTDLTFLNETLRQEVQAMERKYDKLLLEFKMKNEQYLEKEAEVGTLNLQLENLRLIESEKTSLEGGMAVYEEELLKARNELKAKEVEIVTLLEQIHSLQKEKDRTSNMLRIKESENEELQFVIRQVKDENNLLGSKYQEAEDRLTSLMDDMKEKDGNIASLEETRGNLKSELESSLDECKSLQKTLEDTRSKILDLVEDLEKAKQQAGSKDEELIELRDEVLKMKLVIEENEKVIEDKKEVVSKMQVSRRRESVEMNDLKSVVECKSKEIESLNKKYETLDTYLSHRETALSHARDELNEIKSKHASCTTTISFMENQITDKDQLIARLEKQRNRLEREKEEEVQNAVRNKDDNETKNSSLAALVEEKGMLIKELEEKVEKFQTDLDESRKELSSYKNMVKEKDSRIDSLTNELDTAKHSIENLEKTLTEKKNNEENDKNSFRVSEDPQKRFSGGTPAKDSKMIKQLWDEIAKKDSKLQDLEKQLKDRGKQLNSLRKNQNLEKQTQFLTDKNKSDGNQQVVELKEDVTKRDERISMLEDALRESVSIAAEREELLAQHVEFSEEAGRSIRELETDVDRLTMEKGITNIKNSFLILSLAERDTLLASLKSMKKRNIEELMNIKQAALLAAISEKDSNIALLELQSSSKSRKQEIKQCKSEKDKLVNELKLQTQQRITVTNNEENKEGFLYKELEDSPNELILQALRSLSDSGDKLEFYIDALLSFVKEKNLEILKEMPTLQKRSQKSLDKLRNASKSQLLREFQRCEEDCAQLKSFVEILLEKLEG